MKVKGEIVQNEFFWAPFWFGLYVCIGKGEVGHSQCDLSLTPVQHKPPPQCSRFSENCSLCVCSCLIFHPWPLLFSKGIFSVALPVKTALLAGPLTTCYTFIVENISCSFTFFPCSASNGSSTSRCVLPASCSPGAEFRRMPTYPGITSHCMRLTSLCVAEEVTVNLKPADSTTAGQ